jgi:hypothetical protein
MMARGHVKGLCGHRVDPIERTHGSLILSFQAPAGAFHVETHPVGHPTDFQRYG